ncbi:arsenic resistance protein [Niveispirillum fermenti]|uniref:arsenic resistance protein n=1 Tax=Niveispirillum fermenti TaxID=1233113 RepID=UPI003A88CBF3
MMVTDIRGWLEHRQIGIYVAAVAAAAGAGLVSGGLAGLEGAINPALALMLFVTFQQVPVAEMGRAFGQARFLVVLLLVNFILLPLLVALLVRLLPDDPLVRLGVMLVLLTPCIDYVVTFSHLGRGDARLLLASTPVLLVVQMLLLPLYLRLFLGQGAAGLVQAGPFLHAFLWLIAVPLLLAFLVQVGAARSRRGEQLAQGLGYLPVPATALVLFIVVAAVVPQLGAAIEGAWRVVPVYIAFAVLAPAIGWGTGRLFGLAAPAGRAVAFSAGTRNSLVVLPLGLAVPGAVPLLPAIIVTQTLVELLCELAYIRIMPGLGRADGQTQS